MYLDELAEIIRQHVPPELVPDADDEDLFRLYALLLRAKGSDVTLSDVHDAWSSWMARQNPEHVSLLPYEELPTDVQQQDRAFAEAVRLTAIQTGQVRGRPVRFGEVLFPKGPPMASDAEQVFDLYRLMVDSSESLVRRRHTVNTFFLTMNGALLTAYGLIVQNARDAELGALAVAVLALAAAGLCGAWISLINSFGQLNSGKFKVINSIEKHLAVSIYAAEWEALERGENPKVYRSFTDREVWVPKAFLGLHVLTTLAAGLVFFGLLKLGQTG